jgi:hypothetical protein
MSSSTRQIPRLSSDTFSKIDDTISKISTLHLLQEEIFRQTGDYTYKLLGDSFQQLQETLMSFKKNEEDMEFSRAVNILATLKTKSS